MRSRIHRVVKEVSGLLVESDEMEDLLNGGVGDLIAHLGVGGVIALIVFYYARQDANRHKAEWKIASNESRELSEKLMTIIQQNSETITKNTGVVAQTEIAVRELRNEVSRASPRTRVSIKPGES